jgi:hypothetical protein
MPRGTLSTREASMIKVLRFIAGVFLALFAFIWLWVAWKLLTFDPSETVPTLEFSDGQAATAGLLSAAVAASTASVLGIEIQKARTGTDLGVQTISNAIQASLFLKAGIIVYLLVGVVNLLVWFFNTDVAPEMVASFALGALGWMGGAFGSAFQSSNSGQPPAGEKTLRA